MALIIVSLILFVAIISSTTVLTFLVFYLSGKI